VTRSGSIVFGFVVLLVGIDRASAQATGRASVSSTGAQADAACFFPIWMSTSVSADGRYVVFATLADDLVPGDTNGLGDVFVRDRWSGTTERASVDSAGAQADSESYAPTISADGRWVAFGSVATNLVAGDTNGRPDCFVHDRLTGVTERVSVDSAGAEGDDSAGYAAPSISDDGRFVAFESWADNLVPGDTNGTQDIFVHDRQTGATVRVSVDPAGNDANSSSNDPSISADGRYVAFTSLASNLVAADVYPGNDVFVRDLASGTTVLVSVDSNGIQGNSDSLLPSITPDGRFVVFESMASNLDPVDTNVAFDVFVRDLAAGTTAIVSVDSLGVPGGSDSVYPSISADGRYVAFESLNIFAQGEFNAHWDVFVRDRQSGTTEWESTNADGAQSNFHNHQPWISGDGRFVAFQSGSTDLVHGDTNGFDDIFVRDRAYAPFASLCDPGTGPWIACPCSNPPSGAGRGCDNSAATGGASLAASGIAYLSDDTLVFTTADEKPTATSILLQGTTSPASGITYGQGVRCVGGNLKRLYVKAASGGSITAPDFPGGDPSVSARSAARGDVIGAGQNRFYLVYYRDPVVLGGCAATSTFNATQTGRVSWLP
jgi:Tol biopolymer transport system component